MFCLVWLLEQFYEGGVVISIYMISLISGIQYTAQMNLSTEKKIIDLENRLVAALGEREGVGGFGAWG